MDITLADSDLDESVSGISRNTQRGRKRGFDRSSPPLELPSWMTSPLISDDEDYAGLPNLSLGTKLLDPFRPIKVQGRPDLTEQGPSLASNRAKFLQQLASRQLAVIIGYAILHCGTEEITQQPIEIQSLQVTSNFIRQPSSPPHGDEGEDQPDSDPSLPRVTSVAYADLDNHREWPEFHLGVAESLRPRSASQIAATPEVAAHKLGGYLYGLGFLGGLDHLGRQQIWSHMSPRDPLASAGLLLGRAIQGRSSLGSTLDRVINLNLAMDGEDGQRSSTEAALMATAILYMGTCQALAAKGILKYLVRFPITSGIAAGLTYLGQGTGDLLYTIHQEYRKARESDPLVSLESNRPDLILQPGVALSVGIAFLASGNREAAFSIDLPGDAGDLELLRFDDLVVRKTAYYLIMLDEVQPTWNWLRSQLPAYLSEDPLRFRKDTHGQDLLGAGLSFEACEVYCAHMVAASMAIGLKYRSSGRGQAAETLCRLSEQAMRSLSEHRKNNNFDRRAHVFRNTADSVLLSWSLVVAGTGDIDLMRRLRLAHFQISEESLYPSHLATHMAMGFLFLGKGRYTLRDPSPRLRDLDPKSAKVLPIAALWVACQPVFEMSPNDFETFFPPLRHFWAFAVSERVPLTPKDDGIDGLCTENLPIDHRMLAEDFGHVREISEDLIPKTAFDVQALVLGGILGKVKPRDVQDSEKREEAIRRLVERGLVSKAFGCSVILELQKSWKTRKCYLADSGGAAGGLGGHDDVMSASDASDELSDASMTDDLM